MGGGGETAPIGPGIDALALLANLIHAAGRAVLMRLGLVPILDYVGELSHAVAFARARLVVEVRCHSTDNTLPTRLTHKVEAFVVAAQTHDRRRPHALVLVQSLRLVTCLLRRRH